MRMSTVSPARVLIADSYPLLVNGLRHLLLRTDDLSLVGEATSGSQALNILMDSQPEVAVLDIALPGLNGIDLLRRLSQDSFRTRVVILSAFEESMFVQRALAAGALGFVLKRSDMETTLQAIRAVLRGGLYIDPAVAGHLVAMSKPEGPPVTLTIREREVIRLIAFGLTGKEIAGRLGITAKSVETYKSRASEKLGLRTRAQMVQHAALEGWFGDISEVGRRA
ncbi:response regulator [Methylobacterium tarhaniae]|uniref:response regulator n=1 Tax=Methylobacterium tarhaniae TaxID=1187852 RepID=UPI003D06DD42